MVPCLTAMLRASFIKIMPFFCLDDRIHIVNAQHDLAIPSSVLLALPVSSPCLDANEEIDLQATGSLGCWSLHLCQTNQMWVEESSELLVAKGY